MRMRDTLAQLAAARQSTLWASPATGRLTSFVPAGSNPGALAARIYVPEDLPAGAPLVVVLHGCTQTAEGYDAGTGWSQLADRAGFALLFPEQVRANNGNLCFNWFERADIARHGGEAESIAQMAEEMVAAHALDRDRIYVTGLSAGGAMTAVMLATYPDLFAGGAIVGGLPFASASGVGAALGQMRSSAGGGQSGIDAVARASGVAPDRWPTVSIWHGAADQTVVVGNMEALAAQWRGIHGAREQDQIVEAGDNWERRRWTVADRVVVETWRVTGMGHGVPLDPGGVEGLGAAGAYMLDVGIDSTAAIARSWGLLPDDEALAARPAAVPRKPAPARPIARVAASPKAAPPQPVSGIQTIIEDALRTAGLMK